MARAKVLRSRKRGLFFPFLLLALLAGAYSLYWLYMRSILLQGAQDWIAEQRTAGIEVGYDELRLEGFPFRHTLTVQAPSLVDPRSGWGWRGERLQLVMQPWNWFHVLARSPGENRVMTPQGVAYDLTLGRGTIASLSWTPEAINRAALSVDTAEMREDGRSVGSLEGLVINLGPVPEAAKDLRLAIDWRALRLPGVPAEAPWLGRDVSPGTVKLIFTEFFSSIETHDPVSAWLLADGRIDVAQVMLDWGPLDVQLAGQLGSDARGRVKGTLKLRLERADELKAAMSAARALTPEARRVIDNLKLLSEGPQGAAPFVFSDGAVYFAGAKLADVPVNLLDVRG